MKALLESQAPVITIVGKTSDFHVTEVLRVSLEENLAMIARERSRFLREPGREVIYDAEHFFDGWKANPEYAAARRSRPPPRPAPRSSCCATPTAAACPRKSPRSPSEAAAGARRAGRHPLPQRLRAGRRQFAGRRRRRRRPGAGHDQRPRRALRQRRPDLRHRQSGASRSRATKCSAAAASSTSPSCRGYVYEMANMHFRTNQPFVGPSAFAHKGGMHVHAVTRATASYEHIAPERGRQRAARPGERALRPLEHRRPDHQAQPAATTAR